MNPGQSASRITLAIKLSHGAALWLFILSFLTSVSRTNKKLQSHGALSCKLRPYSRDRFHHLIEYFYPNLKLCY